MERLAEELSRGDEDGEQNEDDGRELAVQSVDQVVVERRLEAAQLQRRSHHALHPAAAAAAGDDRARQQPQLQAATLYNSGVSS